jgi:hypothetical protein
MPVSQTHSICNMASPPHFWDAATYSKSIYFSHTLAKLDQWMSHKREKKKAIMTKKNYSVHKNEVQENHYLQNSNFSRCGKI